MSRPDGTQAPAADVDAAAEQIAATAAQLRAQLERLVTQDGAPAVPDQALHDLVVAAAKLLFAKREAGQNAMPFDEPELTATEVMVIASAMLKAANLEVFELTMWNGFSTL